MKLVLFDFDGTLTTKDSFLEFIKFTHGSGRFWLGMLWLSPLLIAMKLSLVSNEFAKAKLLSLFYKNKSKDEIDHWALAFHKDYLPKILRTEGIKKIKEYQADNQEVALVSASVDMWLQPFANQHQLNLICTKAAYLGNRFSGKFDSLNCIGPEKVRRVCKEYDLKKFDQIIAFGDSKGDKEMLALADEAHFKPFR